jgi:DNA-binding SARP family transcriptional activator
MTAKAASGSYDSAVHTYREYAEMLARDIGDRPGRVITDLYTQIRDQLGHATSQPP